MTTVRTETWQAARADAIEAEVIVLGNAIAAVAEVEAVLDTRRDKDGAGHCRQFAALLRSLASDYADEARAIRASEGA